MVGSITVLPAQDTKITRGEDIGYFAYGGSTVIVLFPREMNVVFDEDLLENSRQGVETVFEVGMGIGVCGTGGE